MPIKNLTEITRFPRAGIIRLGVREKTQNKCKCGGKDKNHFICKGTGFTHRIKEVDYFVVPKIIEKVYGKKPKRIKIVIPVEDEEIFFRQYYYRYGNGVMLCRGDGVQGVFFNFDTGQFDTKECPCEMLEAKKCSKAGVFQFLMPDVPEAAGVWQITTGSRNSIIDINSGIRFIRGIAGRIAFVPIWLTREEMTTSKLQQETENQKGVIRGRHWTMKFSIDATLEQLHKLGKAPEAAAFLPEPIDTGDELIEDGNGDPGAPEALKAKEKVEKEVVKDVSLYLSDGTEKILSRHEAYMYFERVKSEMTPVDYDLIVEKCGYKHYSQIPSEDMNGVYKLLLGRITIRKKEKSKAAEGDQDQETK